MTATRPPDEHRPRRAALAPAALYEGTAVTAATTATDRVDVAVAGLQQGRHTIRGCRFMPRGATLPAVGDPCVVALTDRRSGVVQWWEPA